jgi:hypothetical protein
MSKDSFDPRFDPAFQPGFDKPVASAPRTAPAPASSSPAQVALDSARREAEKAVPDATAVEESGRRANPFLIALGILSVVLIAGGLGISQWIRAQFAQTDIRVDVDFFTLDSLKIASPLAIALGIAIAAGVLFVYAINWQKRES